MAREVIEQKLESLRRCLLLIESKIPDDKSKLTADYDLQDIIALNLSRAVPLALDIGAHLIAGVWTCRHLGPWAKPLNNKINDLNLSPSE